MDRHSRMVTILKVVLPLAALAILSTLFLLGRSVDPTATIPFAGQEMAERMRNQQVTAPVFSGITSNGDRIMVSADVVRPGGPDVPAEADQLWARIITAEGTRIEMQSRHGNFDLPGDVATFEGEVEIDSSIGTTLVTETLIAALSGVRAEAPGRVRGSAVMGQLDAGAMLLTTKNEGGPIHMLFKNGVKLIYDPKQPER